MMGGVGLECGCGDLRCAFVVCVCLCVGGWVFLIDYDG